MLIFAAMLIAQAAAPVEAEVVVTARRRKCDISIANRTISDREFKKRAAEWAAGIPVRVVAPRQADIRCLAKIAFRLADHGVTRIHFVEPGL
ncbi:MAG: hypothetical protein V4659_05585 [Pseudomonadota bacterium]